MVISFHLHFLLSSACMCMCMCMRCLNFSVKPRYGNRRLLCHFFLMPMKRLKDSIVPTERTIVKRVSISWIFLFQLSAAEYVQYNAGFVFFSHSFCSFPIIVGNVLIVVVVVIFFQQLYSASLCPVIILKFSLLSSYS